MHTNIKTLTALQYHKSFHKAVLKFNDTPSKFLRNCECTQNSMDKSLDHKIIVSTSAFSTRRNVQKNVCKRIRMFYWKHRGWKFVRGVASCVLSWHGMTFLIFYSLPQNSCTLNNRKGKGSTSSYEINYRDGGELN